MATALIVISNAEQRKWSVALDFAVVVVTVSYRRQWHILIQAMEVVCKRARGLVNKNQNPSGNL